jgi:hypothetical protein
MLPAKRSTNPDGDKTPGKYRSRKTLKAGTFSKG